MYWKGFKKHINRSVTHKTETNKTAKSYMILLKQIKLKVIKRHKTLYSNHSP